MSEELNAGTGWYEGYEIKTFRYCDEWQPKLHGAKFPRKLKKRIQKRLWTTRFVPREMHVFTPPPQRRGGVE